MKANRSALTLAVLLLLLSAVAAVPAAAQGIAFVGEGPAVGEAHAGRDGSARIPLTFGLDSSWSENRILGAAHAPGRYGSYYRTDLYVMAPCAGASGNVVFQIWSLPNGATNNASQMSRVYTIPAGGFGIIPDVVGQFGQTGGSTLDLEVVSSASTVTSSCRELSSWAKTSTLAENGGEYSTGLLSTFGNTICSSRYGAITGVEQNDTKRTNVILMTPYSSTGVARLYVFDERGQFAGQKDVTISPYSATQVSLTEFAIAAPGGSLRVAVSPLSPTSYFYFEAAAVTVDNRTNDGFFRHFTIHDF